MLPDVPMTKDLLLPLAMTPLDEATRGILRSGLRMRDSNPAALEPCTLTDPRGT